uniref:Transposase Tc1-like domain-containing protein n=1 Tax=Anguilla anguilla TaxID=7936 RepID=A0A0E9QC94_ANGAN
MLKRSQIRNPLQEAGMDVSVTTVFRRLHEQNYRGDTARCKPQVSFKNRTGCSLIRST